MYSIMPRSIMGDGDIICGCCTGCCCICLVMLTRLAACDRSTAARLTSETTSFMSCIFGPSSFLMESFIAGPSAPHRPSTALASLPTCLDMSLMHFSVCADRLSWVTMNSMSCCSSCCHGSGREGIVSSEKGAC